MAYTTAANLSTFMRQYNYDGMLDRDEDGTADTTVVTFWLTRGANMIDHYNTDFTATQKEELNLIISAYKIFNNTALGPMPAGLEDDYKWAVKELENHRGAVISVGYDPEEIPTEDYIEDLLESPTDEVSS